MDILTLIWNFLLGLLPSSRQPALARSARQLCADDARTVTGGTTEARIDYGWMTAARFHPHCARPPCRMHGGDGPAGLLPAIHPQLRR